MLDRDSILKSFLLDVFVGEDAQRDILHFMMDWNIRSGEYKSGSWVLRKLDPYQFVLVLERLSLDTVLYRTAGCCAAFCRGELLEAMAGAAGKGEAELSELAKSWRRQDVR